MNSKKIRVMLITGSLPPEPCGVGDFTSILRDKLVLKRNVSVGIALLQLKWSFYRFIKFVKEIREFAPDIIHIQYPTAGYRFSLAPHLISIFCNSCIVTIHEVSQINFLRRISLILFTFRCHIVFTSQYERDYAIKLLPWIKKRSEVIPIATAIHPTHIKKKDNLEVVYFGLIRPDKGIEDVIKLAELIKKKGMNISVRIIGKVPISDAGYFEKIKKDSLSLPILWSVGLSDIEVSAILGKCSIGYLPFPDGVSERRSSLLAMMINEVVVVSTKGKFTTKEMENAIQFAQQPLDALHIIDRLMRNSRERLAFSKKSKDYALLFSWDNLVSRHLSLYKRILGSGSGL